MAAHSLSDDGAMSSSWNGAAGRRNGSTGYCHLAVGAGFSGMNTSAILSPGQPEYLHGINVSYYFLCLLVVDFFFFFNRRLYAYRKKTGSKLFLYIMPFPAVKCMVFRLN